MSWSEREEDLVQEAVDLIWREHGRVNGTPCYEAALRMLQCSRAAEERGWRRGLEETAKYIASVGYAHAAILARKNLAPRDSGPQVKCKHGKAGVACDRCPWCWSVKCPGTDTPRDSGKEPK